MKKGRKNLEGNYKSDKLSNDGHNIISKKRFLLNDQFDFARFSGDKNPIHLDKIAARRTLHGQCIVHGMHSLLWALDSLAKEKNITSTKIGVRFLKPIFLGEEVYCVWNEINKQLSILISETTFAIIDLEIGEITPNNEILTPIKEVPHNVPRELTLIECSKLSNQPFKIYGDTNLAVRLFPSFSSLYGIAIACEIGAISQIVGMECPGLHSLFTGLKVEINRNNIKPIFGVSKIDKRFNLLKISVNGNTLVAVIQSFLRPRPSINLNISKLSKLVKKNEFKNINALIIGGSRGLGEVVAKLIAAGGGKSTITYHVGSIEANKVIREIRAWGGRCKMTQLTIDEKCTFPLIDSNINQLYYFASPKILGNISKDVDQKMLSSYQLTYVDYFNNICKQLLSKDSSFSVFYPSTIAIDMTPPGWENYVHAKIEGEKLCMELNKNNKIDIIAPRLPRMDTDLTQSLIIQKSVNNAEILLPFIRQMHV